MTQHVSAFYWSRSSVFQRFKTCGHVARKMAWLSVIPSKLPWLWVYLWSIVNQPFCFPSFPLFQPVLHRSHHRDCQHGGFPSAASAAAGWVACRHSKIWIRSRLSAWSAMQGDSILSSSHHGWLDGWISKLWFFGIVYSRKHPNILSDLKSFEFLDTETLRMIRVEVYRLVSWRSYIIIVNS